MVQVLPVHNPWAEIGQDLLGGIESYKERSDQLALQRAVTNLPENATPQQILEGITKTVTYSPKAKQQALENAIGVSKMEELSKQIKVKEGLERKKVEKEREDVKAIVKQNKNLTEEQKEVLGETLDLKSATDLTKDFLKGSNEKLTPFEKKVQEKNADEYINLSKEIPKLQDSVGTIAEARKLSKELTGLGMLSAKAGFTTQTGKQLEGLTFPLIEPILKILAPSGAIAKEKLLRTEAKYAILASDPAYLREAKLNALEYYAKQSLNRAQMKMDLIKKYEGNPPDNVVEKFDRESDTISDAMLDFPLTGQEYKGEVPNGVEASKFNGKEMEFPDGNTYKSVGGKWIMI